MTEDNRLSKVEILIQQKKYGQAAKVLKDLLAEDPNDIHFLSLFAEVLLQQDKFDAAGAVIDNAIGLAPDSPVLYHTKARIAIIQNRLIDAEKLLAQSIEIDPNDADYYSLLAHVKLNRKQYSEALETANQALEIDPENLLALNTRSTALTKLDRSEESFATIEGALREDPNNAYTHANYGWGLLEKGDHKKALEHFKESLKNDPNSEYAQSGMLEALKATNPVYRVFLRYSFWMSNLTSNYQWGVIIGFYIVFKALRTIARSNETLQPYLIPIIIALAFIAFSTWIITPISNLFLRFNKYGQLLLDKNEKMSSNFVAGSVGVLVVGIGLFLIMNDERFLSVAVFGFAMMLPFGVMFSPSKYKNALLIYSMAMSVVGLAGIALTFSTGDMFNMMNVIFIISFIAFQWIANFLIIKEDNQHL